MFRFSLQKEINRINLLGVPMLSPYIQAVNESSGQYLFAGGFPNSPRSQSLPPELFQRLATKNLVFYHWEITSERVSTMLQPSQLVLLLTGHVQLDGNSAAFKWLNSIAPRLGNTDTEITQTAPDQLTFIRKAPGIFTSVELYALANWLEARNFPGCDLSTPPFKRIRHPHPPGAALAPPSAAK